MSEETASTAVTGDDLWNELYATIDVLEERIRSARQRARQRAEESPDEQ